jgi:hemerythrin
MALIEWKDAFNTGDPSVDFEHRGLIDLINELYDNLSRNASTEDVLDFFGEIHARIAAHFALEEKTMRDAAYGEYGPHKADHERLLDDIRDMMDGYEAGEFADFEATLTGRLRAWFMEHFATFDARLHARLG